MSFSEFRPTILFLVKFVGIYLVGNILYGLYITSYEPRPDPVTHVVSKQTALVLNTCGYQVEAADRQQKPTTDLMYLGRAKLSVYEGCNGLNTMIIFVAFLFAFGPVSKTLIWFIPAGLMIIHLMNLARISLLFFVSEYMPDAMYFTHKYFFTAILYVVIFVLWVWWVKRYSRISTKHEEKGA
jgi:exosortase family protein XrtF